MNKHLFGLQEPYTHKTDHLHPRVYDDFLKLQERARSEKIELKVASGFRSFQRQKEIWNSKASGHKTLLDKNSHPLKFDQLDKEELLFAILNWSALPGLSRHHWGSDFDVYDENALTENYQIQLIPQEYSAQGIFKKLGAFLDNLQGEFFRPYERDLGGVAREPWHLSHREISRENLDALTVKEIRLFFESEYCHDLLLREEILKNLETIYERFVINIC